jgi:two-component system chemotaxis response regulator CheB
MTLESTQPRASGPAAILIGGSAGALEVLTELLPALPRELTLPLIVLLHLQRRRPSLLAGLLSQKTSRPVREPMDKELLAPSVVYVAPPDYQLLIDEGPSFAFSVDDPVNFSLPSIDVLFESAADVLGNGAAGVLLSGASSDGARGLKAIADAGGVAIVQAPEESANRRMPEAAIAMCPTSRVLSVCEIRQWMRSWAGAAPLSGQGTP